MQRLGEILIEKGVLSLAELHTALETCHRTGGRLGTQLLDFGYVDEPMLLDALSKQLRVPSVSRVKLLHAPLEVRKMLPVAIGRRLLAVPFQVTGTDLKVAMANPNDRAAVDEISVFLKRSIQPHVATETAVVDALGGTETNDDVWASDVEPSAAQGPTNGDVDGWNGLWEPPRFRPAALFRPLPERRAGNEMLVASFPDLAPLSAPVNESFQPTVDDSNFSDLLHRAEHRDEIGSVLARYLSTLYDRVCLFSLHKGTIGGWMARGRSVVLEDLQSFSIAVDEDSVFATLGSRDSFVGGLEDGPANSELVQALADPAPAEVVLLPVSIKQRVIAFALCDVPGLPVPAEHLDAAMLAARKAGVAFEVLILRKKLLA
jgi:hypothetical protein